MAHTTHTYSVLLSLSIVLPLFLLTGCNRVRPPVNTANITQLENLSAGRARAKNALRHQFIRDTALSLGARGGLAWRSKEINKILVKHEPLLYRLFNFNAMLLEKNVLPPVLIEGRNTLTLTGTDVIRIADRTFHILSQARFVTAAPNWRDYLWMKYTPPEQPDRALLPKNREEKIAWKIYIDQGWQAGVQQGDLIFKENIGRLKRDYEGMIRYRTLLAQNMVSPPFVAQLDMGVTGGGSNLTVNDKVLRITALPALRSDSQNWKAGMTPDE
jgi:defect-in-organelle-trafficking protein DotC